MPDGLWYPHGRYYWSDGGNTPASDRNHFVGLSIIEMMSSIKRRARAEMRNAGADRLAAYQRSHYVSSLARGFHRSRIEGSGFTMHRMRDWQAERKGWKEAHSGEIEPLEEAIAKARGGYEMMIEVLAGRLPPLDEVRQNRLESLPSPPYINDLTF
jgi:hypothetical protein